MPEDIESVLARKVTELEHQARRSRARAALDVRREARYANGIIKTVGASGRDYTTIQAALNFFAGKICNNCYVDVDAGTYNEPITMGNNWFGELTLRGDTRNLVGLTYVGGYSTNTVPMNRQNISNGGSGNCTLSNSGNTITVTGSTTSPNFATAGLVAGDKCYVLDTSLAWTLMTIQSVSSNTITFTTTCPTVNSTLGVALTILPNRWITQSAGTVLYLRAKDLRMTINGFTAQQSNSTATAEVIGLSDTMTLIIQNCAVIGGYFGCTMGLASYLLGGNAVTWSSAGLSTSQVHYGVYLQGANFNLDRGVFVGNNKTSGLQFGFVGDYFNLFGSLTEATIANFYQGVRHSRSGNLNMSRAAVVNCGTGVLAERNSFVNATQCDGYAKGNTTNYNPATSLAESASGAWIEHTT